MYRFVGKTCPVRRATIIARHISQRKPLYAMAQQQTSVGIIIIGDEILKGQVKDTNSHFITKRLFPLGAKVKRISVIPDDLESIRDEVKQFSAAYTYVITSGGIGPTHDDMTFEGVAQAFGEETHLHPDLAKVISEYFKTDDYSSPKFKLAQVPKSASLNYGKDEATGKWHFYPVVNVKNVYIFPGVPNLLEKVFVMLEHKFKNPNESFHVKEVFVQQDEMSIAGVLNEVNATFKDKIILGSYPNFTHSYYKVRLTVQSDNMSQVEEACKLLKDKLQQGSVIDYERDPVSVAMDRIYAIKDSTEDTPYISNVQHAISTIEECLNRYKLEEVCIGFNGGKDCTALLHLAYAVIRKKFPENNVKLKSLYIRRGQPFPEVDSFIEKAANSYNLEMININGKIREALKEMKETHPQIKAVIMGTRRTDPYSDHLSSFIMTDPDWPQYMRVNPILDWSYSEVWQFLRSLSLPYCSLYDRGYTSLGSMENTHPNPSLQKIDTKGSITYLPAYKLGDCESERAGRN